MANFLNTLKRIIRNTNDAKAEDGHYNGVHLLELDGNVFIQFIDMEEDLKVKTYKVDVNALEAPYRAAYEKDGGNTEYESIVNAMLYEKVVKQYSTKL